MDELPTTLELVKDAIEKLCEIAREQVTPDAVLAEIGVDSLQLAELLWALEDKIGAEIEVPSKLPRTVADLLSLVEPYMGRSAPS